MPSNIDKALSQKHWAVIGVSKNSAKYGNKVYCQLKKAGYSVYAINPGLESINGDPCYPSLAALPTVPDAVSVVCFHQKSPSKLSQTVSTLESIEFGCNPVVKAKKRFVMVKNTGSR